MTLEQLYTQYGKQMIDRQILNSQIQQTEQALATELNKANQKNEQAVA